MNKQQAREILKLFRPGTEDEADSFFAEARQLAKTDPELAGWHQEQCEAYLALRRKLQAVPVPPTLKARLFQERKIHRPRFRSLGPVLAVAAAVVLLVGVLSMFGAFHSPANSFAAYRKRMTETALRTYTMVPMADADQIRKFLQANNAPADYSLPAGIKNAAVVGCAVSSWQGHPVSMLCFKTGRPLPPGDQSDLWLFVADRSAFPKAPPPGAPVFGRLNKARTASWSDDKKTYLLAVVGNEELLGKFLQ